MIKLWVVDTSTPLTHGFLPCRIFSENFATHYSLQLAISGNSCCRQSLCTCTVLPSDDSFLCISLTKINQALCYASNKNNITCFSILCTFNCWMSVFCIKYSTDHRADSIQAGRRTNFKKVDHKKYPVTYFNEKCSRTTWRKYCSIPVVPGKIYIQATRAKFWCLFARHGSSHI